MPRRPQASQIDLEELLPQPQQNPTPVMSDEPFEDELGDPYDVNVGVEPVEIIPPVPSSVGFESRIQIYQAWRYPGTLVSAPEWIDRNWVGWGEFDPIRNIEPGPALRIPTRIGVTLARIGDYVTQQSTRLTVDDPGEPEIEVWSSDQFQKLFLPVPKNVPAAAD